VDGPGVAAAVAEAHRREWAFVLAATVRVTRDIDLAEECVQDAYAQALATWADRGVPAKPGAWLTTVARRRALDLLRREVTLRRALPLLVDDEPADAAGGPFPDDRLRLVFTCCHPALSMEARVALTLKVVAGLSTEQVARMFLVPEATMSQRLIEGSDSGDFGDLYPGYRWRSETNFYGTNGLFEPPGGGLVGG